MRGKLVAAIVLAGGILFQGSWAGAKSVGFVDNNRTYVPVRYLSEQLGFQVAWDAANQEITVRNSTSTLKMTLGKQEAELDGKSYPMDVTPYVVDGITYVPLRFVSEMLGLQVEWVNEKVPGVQIVKNQSAVFLPTVTKERWEERKQDPIQYEKRTFTIGGKKLSANIVSVDLLHPAIRLKVSLAEGGVGSVEGLSSIANRHNASLAVNGTFFDAYSTTEVKIPYGYIVEDGTIKKEAPTERRSVILFDKQNNVEMIYGDAFRERFKKGDVEGALQAGPRLVTDGQITVDPVNEGCNDPKILTNAGARSAIGITADHKLVILTTGGATIPQLAEMMLQAGTVYAMNLDGGASSGLYVRGKYITTPGREISNALLVLENDPN